MWGAERTDAAVSVRPTPVEVLTPKPPTPVMADGKRVLVYELHITNFGSTPFELQRLEISSQDSANRLQTLSGEDLKKCLRPLGDASDPAKIDVGRRVIVFLWIALSPDQAVPEKLRHRLSFTMDDPKQPGINESVLDNVMVPVLHDPVPMLSSPFDDGEWYAGSGPSNFSVHRRSLMSLQGGVFDAQRFAIDWGLIGKNGDTKHDDTSKNENYWCYGQPVHAVADGEVSEVVDRYPDNQPGVLPKEVTVESASGNHVILKIGEGQYVLFAHLKTGSVRVHTGDRIKRGDVIGQVGNSGNSSGSHLHLHVMDRNSPLASEGIPFVFDHFQFLEWGKDFDANKIHPDVPHRNEIPVDDMVTRFP
jgi:hypothetical protein